MDQDNNDAPADGPRVVRTAPKSLTALTIGALKVGGKLSDGAIRPGFGSLKVRKRKTAKGSVAEWLFIWRRAGEPEATMTLGKFSAQSAGGCLTLEEARIEARRLQAIVSKGGDPLKARELERAAVKAAEDAAHAVVRMSEEKTLQALLEAYVEGLRARGKAGSAKDARNIFKNHVFGAFPKIAAMPASAVTPEHVSRILARLVGPSVAVKHGRQALKLRSYMSAAFRQSLGSSTDPMAGASSRGFGLTTNPAAAVPATSMAAAFNKAGDRTLSRDELRHYLAYITALPGMTGLALRLQLMAGGQRVQQVLRLKRADVGDGVIKLYDPKGRRTQARTHVLPMIDELAEIVAELDELSLKDADKNPDDWLFSGRSGAAMVAETPSAAVLAISDTMVHLGQASKPFRGGDIRRTCETMLAETLGISRDTRAQLLSHGLTGVQERHYDKGTHLDAKRAALRAWCDLLADIALGGNAAGGNVVPIKRSA